jgi:CyaY protein
MAGNTYFERIEAIFEQVETGLEELPDDLDIRTA